jgi:hypothetical protein
MPLERRRGQPLPSALTIRAGATARRVLAERGFDRDAFSTLIGASGGPKWLVLAGLDRVLPELLLSRRSTALDLVGSSIGAFRHACLAQRDSLGALDRFEAAYIEQAYERRPTPEEVTAESRRILDVLLGSHGIREILANEQLRTHVIAVRSRLPVASDARWALSAGLGAAAAANAVARRLLALFFQRVVFSVGAPGLRFRGFGTREIVLDERNLSDALIASGSIPLVMAGIVDIPGAPRGRYRDGGIIDYHFDFRFDSRPGLTLYPHFFQHITPGWFDKALRWRGPARSGLHRVVMLSPSRDFVAKLPGGRIPDRSDFASMPTAERQRAWRDVVARSRALGDELGELAGSRRFADSLESI